MDILLDPNLAYFLLVGGLLLAILALFAPGTGFIEIGAFFALAIAGYAIANPELPINPWALIILLVGVFPFILALRKSQKWVFLVIALVALIVGSVFLFEGPEGRPAVDPLLATIVSLSAGGLIWLIINKGLEAISQAPSHTLNTLLGAAGIARTDIHTEGTVYIGSEEWSAQSGAKISAGTKVKIIDREGLVLFVEPFDNE